MTTGELVTSYLARVGYDDRPEVSVDGLAELHRRHLAAVPYENLSIMLGAPPPVDPLDSLARVVRVGRAGYCFHQNGALEVVLGDLGYRVTRRGGHVWTAEEDRWTGSLNHLVLVVSGLPTEANPTGEWWPDVGLGDALLEPLPLVVGDYEQGGFGYAVTEVREDGWSFRAAAAGSFTGVEVGPAPSSTDIERCHTSLSTPPDGRFAKLLVVQRRMPHHVDVVRGCVGQRVMPEDTEEADLTTYDEWRGAIADGCGLSLAEVDDDALRTLFAQQLGLHLAWDRAGRP
jgi:N-hydroxyarylamine O-acetyltransferase